MHSVSCTSCVCRVMDRASFTIHLSGRLVRFFSWTGLFLSVPVSTVTPSSLDGEGKVGVRIVDRLMLCRL